jgi:hypothetical protein
VKRQTTFLFIILTLFVATACKKLTGEYEDVQVASADEKACGFIQNSSGSRVSWDSRLPVTFQIEQSVPENFRVAIVNAADDWNRSSGKTLIKISPDIASSDQWKIDGKNMIYWINQSGVFTTSSQQAKSLLRWQGMAMSDVDILINASDWKFYLTEPENTSALHLESLMVHEFGHALGLIHQPLSKSVMYMSLGGSVVRTQPLPDPELQDLGCEYL